MVKGDKMNIVKKPPTTSILLTYCKYAGDH